MNVVTVTGKVTLLQRFLPNNTQHLNIFCSNIRPCSPTQDVYFCAVTKSFRLPSYLQRKKNIPQNDGIFLHGKKGMQFYLLSPSGAALKHRNNLARYDLVRQCGLGSSGTEQHPSKNSVINSVYHKRQGILLAVQSISYEGLCFLC